MQTQSKYTFKAFKNLILLFLIGLFIFKFSLHVFGYNRNLNSEPQILSDSRDQQQYNVGFSAISITPQIMDTWKDVDGNAKYEPKNGDTYNDLNGNGKFDAYWIAGFHPLRAANHVHDSLWARTMVIDDGYTRIAMVSLDVVGLVRKQIVEIRERISEKLNVDYCLVASTHVHGAPDVLGLWGKRVLWMDKTTKQYIEFVIRQTVKSIETAVSNLEPVILHFAKDDSSSLHLVKDTRRPIVHDPGIYIIQAKKHNGIIKGTLISWSNHPDVLGRENLSLTSDFPHYLRKGIEGKFGGICVYFNGALGGKITSDPVSIRSPESGKFYQNSSFEKAKALGDNLTIIASEALKNSQDFISQGSIKYQIETFNVPIRNRNFRIAMKALKTKTEIAAIKIGPATLLTIPGEIFPEIINGGIIAPAGRDFKIEPYEIPPIRSRMPGKYKFVFGLANDELIYIIPKSEWDDKEPWLLNSRSELYGEINSLGPETAPIIHDKAIGLLEKLHKQ